MVKGKGKHQVDQEEKSIVAIYKVLTDGKKHRNKEIKEKTGLKDPTLAKYFKQLVKRKILKKEVDVSGKYYPYPVYYSVYPQWLPIVEMVLEVEKEKQGIEKIIQDPKTTPLDVLERINYRNNYLLLLSLKFFKNDKDKKIPEGLLESMLEICVHQPYKVLMSVLFETSKKVIDKIDVEKLIQQNKNSIHLDLDVDTLTEFGFTLEQVEVLRKKVIQGKVVGL